MVGNPGPRLGPDNNPGNARWCEDHNRMECVKHRSVRQGGGQCHGPAVRGTDACKTHGGHRLEILKAKGEARITAWSALGKAASGTRIEPGMAVLGMLQMSWLRAAAYGELLRQQVVSEALNPDPGGIEPGGMVQANGLIGYKYGAAGRDGVIYAQSEEVRSLVALESAERDRVVRFSKTAHEMGISERLTSLAEKWGDVVATRITMILAGLELTPEQERLVPGLIQKHLSNIDVSSSGNGTEK